MGNKVARTYLRRADFERCVLSEGCPKFAELDNWSGQPQAHSEACPRRIVTRLSPHDPLLLTNQKSCRG